MTYQTVPLSRRGKETALGKESQESFAVSSAWQSVFLPWPRQSWTAIRKAPIPLKILRHLRSRGAPIPTVNRQEELADAKSNPPDTVAWLYIPGAEIDDPVMQAEDNGYYLKLDENGEYAMWGCYYAHCENEIGGRDKLDKNTTIFGHSASNCDPDGVRFTKLYRYMDADFVKEHPYIYLSVDGEDMIFQITALFVTDIGFDYIAPDPTGDDLTSFFETIARKNWLDFDGVTFSEEDTVLTLSTCCRKYDKANSGNQRLVVMAKLLPEGATAQEFSVSLVDSPEMP